jgi:hypothetical protein
MVDVSTRALSGGERPTKMQRPGILAPRACPYVNIRDWMSVRGFTVPHTTIDGELASLSGVQDGTAPIQKTVLLLLMGPCYLAWVTTAGL